MIEYKNEKKVIGIGLHKTGTSTLGDALIKLGYKVVGARLDLTESLKKGHIKPAIQLAKRFDALQDVPWALLYKELDNAFPNSKFILTERNEDKWLNSILKHFGNRHWDMHEWIYGKGVAKGNEIIYRNKYRNHNKEVKQYFNNRPNDLLVMSFENGDEWEKLCDFLNIPVPKTKFPHSNKGKHNYNFQDKSDNFIKKIIPIKIKLIRIKFLKKLGYPDKGDRFNNREQNNKYKGKMLY